MRLSHFDVLTKMNILAGKFASHSSVRHPLSNNQRTIVVVVVAVVIIIIIVASATTNPLALNVVEGWMIIGR